MERNAASAGALSRLHQEGAVRNERFVAECLKKIHAEGDAEKGLVQLLRFLGESLECDRVYVFEEIDRQHIRNTYEWCRAGVPSGIEELPYLAKKDLHPWYGRLMGAGNIIEPDVSRLRQTDPLIYEFLRPQQIHSIVLSPLMSQGRMVGILGADNPPPEKLTHISVLFDVLAYFVSALVSQRELLKLREARAVLPKPKAEQLRHVGKTVLLVDDSRELLLLNERVLRLEGYDILRASTLAEARAQLKKTMPDIIVMDIDLPDGSGIDFCRELRQSLGIPVVFLTARSDEQTAKASLQAGGCAFLTKPYLLETLREEVGKAAEN